MWPSHPNLCALIKFIILIVVNHTIITPTKCTLLLLKAPDITICTFCCTRSTDCNIWCF
jgi:hypothetical protein